MTRRGLSRIARHVALGLVVLLLAACKKRSEGDMDDDGFGMQFMIMQALGGVMVVIPVLIISFLAPVIMYVIARMRANREPVRDEQLGLKFAIGYFQVMSFQLLLLGVFIVLYAMLSKMPSDFKEIPYRIAFGVIVPAGIIYGIHTFALTRTNHRDFPMPKRLWDGYNLMITGLVGMVALIAFFVILFQKGETGDAGRMAGAMMLVYTTAWTVLAIMFIRKSPSGPEIPMAPPPPAQPYPPQGGGHMPTPMQQPLGGGGQQGYAPQGYQGQPQAQGHYTPHAGTPQVTPHPGTPQHGGYGGGGSGPHGGYGGGGSGPQGRGY